MKKFLALLLASIMVLSLCSVSFAETVSVNKEAIWAEKWADVDTSKHVVINYMTTGDAPKTGANAEMLAQLNAILTEKVNAEINIVWISWTDYLANYNLRIAAMDGSIDLIGSSTDWAGRVAQRQARRLPGTEPRNAGQVCPHHLCHRSPGALGCVHL